MKWIDIDEFAVNTVIVNLFKTFALVSIEIIIKRMNRMRITAAAPAVATRASPGPTASQIRNFKQKGIFAYILNSYDEELQI